MYYAVKQVSEPSKKKEETNPNLLEKIVGILSFLILFFQIYYRANEQRAIYLLNPCHICLVIDFYIFDCFKL